MNERYYEQHHWRGAQAWAQIEGTPEEGARELVRRWNSGVGDFLQNS